MTEIPQAALRGRQRYADGDPVSDILAETGLTSNRLYYWVDGGDGRLPPIPRRRASGGIKGADCARRAFVTRMMRAADHSMQQIEARMQSAGLGGGEQDDDVRALAVLARVMRDLTALDESNRQKREAWIATRLCRRAKTSHQPSSASRFGGPRNVNSIEITGSRRFAAAR